MNSSAFSNASADSLADAALFWRSTALLLDAAASAVFTDWQIASIASATVRRTASTAAIGVASAAGSRLRVSGEVRSGRSRSTKRVNQPIAGISTATPTTLYAVW